MEKITYLDMLMAVKNGETLTEAHLEKLDALIEKYSKPRPKSDEPSAKQKANEELQNRIYNCMVEDHEYTLAELIETMDFLNGLSVQKVGPRMRALESIGLVESRLEKKKTYYKKK